MRVRAVTTAWGDWHVGQLLSVALPSLVSDGNLAALCKTHEVSYELCTTRRDADRILASPVFSLLDDIVHVEIHILDESSIQDPVPTHHRVWLESIARARKNAETIFFLPPDTVWSDGSLASLARKLSEGKLALFNTYLRTESDTFVPALLKRFGGAPARMTIPARDLVDLGMQHLHPLMSCYLQEPGHLPEHAEFLLWPVLGEGLLLRLLAREVLCFDPNRIQLTEQALLAELPDLDRLHLFDDSDELCAVSLTPPWKDTVWYQQPRMLDPVRIGVWWLTFDSPMNDILCRRPVRFHRGDCTESAWRAVEDNSAEIVERILARREVLRVCRSLRLAGMSQSALALAGGLLDLDLAEVWRTPATLFLPTNRALAADMSWQFQHLLLEWDGSKLRRFLAAHTVEGLVEFGRPWSSGVAPSERQALRTRLGTSLDVDASEGPPRIGAVRIVGHAFDVAGVRIYPIDGTLPFKPSSRSGAVPAST